MRWCCRRVEVAYADLWRRQRGNEREKRIDVGEGGEGGDSESVGLSLRVLNREARTGCDIRTYGGGERLLPWPVNTYESLGCRHCPTPGVTTIEAYQPRVIRRPTWPDLPHPGQAARGSPVAKTAASGNRIRHAEGTARCDEAATDCEPLLTFRRLTQLRRSYNRYLVHTSKLATSLTDLP